MPKTRKVQLSFSGGELDTQMYGRIDAAQYQSGLATCKNWLVDPRGSLRRRPGMQRVAASLNNSNRSRLIPFTYSVDQQLVIELTDQKARLHVNGETLVWADMREFVRDDVSLTGDTITFLEPHGFVEGQQITFSARVTTGNPLTDPFDALPSPIDNANNNLDGWFAKVVDSKTIQVMDESDVVQNFTALPTAGFAFYAFSHGGVAGRVGPARIYKDWNRLTASGATTVWQNQGDVGTSCLEFGPDDDFRGTFATGDRVQLIHDPNNDGIPEPIPGIPSPLYVDISGCTPGKFTLRTSREVVGTPVTFDNTTTWVNNTQIVASRNANSLGTIWIRQYWQEGDFLYVQEGFAGANQSTDRQRVKRVTADFGSQWNAPARFNDYVRPNLEDAEPDGTFTLTTPYLSSQLFDIEYDQSGDVVTLTHPNHKPQDLKRFSSLEWTIGPVEFNPQLDPPSNVAVTADLGTSVQIIRFNRNTTSGAAQFESFTEAAIAPGDNILITAEFPPGASVEQDNFNKSGLVSGRYYSVGRIIPALDPGLINNAPQPGGNGAGTTVDVFTVRDQDTGGMIVADSSVTTSLSLSTNGAKVRFYYSIANADKVNKYKITAVDSRGQESFGSEEVEVENALSVPAASNTITWDAVQNARSYNVYKSINGTFGFIGQVDQDPGAVNYSFIDDNIGPDLSQTLLIPDDDVQDGYQPRAAARFEQRRCFGGSNTLPRTLFMSRSGTESSFSYRFPTQADDRISVDLASREAHVIRHIVPVQDLLLMTQQGEFRVTAINSDAITPSTIAIRQQSYVGSNSVHPQVVNNSVVFCSNRGGHARQMSFRAENDGYLTGDLSLRAAHLFDGFTLDDLAYTKAPTPILWFVSSSGKLLCLTYIPEERVLAWHQHETDGTIESVCAISEGDFDNVYVVVNRNSSRSVERIVQVREETLAEAVYLDNSIIKDNTNTDDSRKFSVLSTQLYKKGETVTVTAYDRDGQTKKLGLFDSDEVGDVLELTADGQKYRVLFDSYVADSADEFTGKLLTDFPDSLKAVATDSWGWARKTFSGFTHLAGQTVTVLVDGVREESVTVSATGTVTLTDYAVRIVVGDSYTSRAKTLPMSLEIEAGAQGRTKSVNQVFVRVEDTAALQVGMDEADLKAVSELSSSQLKSGEFRTHVPSTWDAEGQIVVEATGSGPASLLNITTQVSLGD